MFLNFKYDWMVSVEKIYSFYTSFVVATQKLQIVFSDGIQGGGGEVGKKKKNMDESAEFAKRKCGVLGERD